MTRRNSWKLLLSPDSEDIELHNIAKISLEVDNLLSARLRAWKQHPASP